MGRPRGAGAETRRLTRSGYEKESNDENGTYLDGAVSDVDLFSSCGWVRREAGISNGSAARHPGAASMQLHGTARHCRLLCQSLRALKSCATLAPSPPHSRRVVPGHV